MRSLIVSASMIFTLAALPGQAQDKPICNSVDESGMVGLAKVTGKARRVHFIASPIFDGKESCPSMARTCQQGAFVVPGDLVIAGERRGGFVCAAYVSAKAEETVGWLPTDWLAMEPSGPAPAPATWRGAWKRVEAEITLKLKGNAVEADGVATWGAGDPNRVRNGAVHSGSFDGAARPSGNELRFGEGFAANGAPDSKGKGCQVRLRLFGRYLVVDDNTLCGGANVRFNGIYVRAKG